MDSINNRESDFPVSASPTKKEVAMINSYNKRLNEQRGKHYRTIDSARNAILHGN